MKSHSNTVESNYFHEYVPFLRNESGPGLALGDISKNVRNTSTQMNKTHHPLQ